MGAKICPICDAKVNKINFCPECKRFVTPKETSQNFYLNEKRPDGAYTNWNGTYLAHDAKKDLTGCHNEFSEIGNGYGSHKEYSGEKYRQQGMQSGIYGQNSKAYGQNSKIYGQNSRKDKQRNRKKKAKSVADFVVVISFIGIWLGLLYVGGYDFDFGFHDSSDNTTIDYDADIPDYADIVGNDYGNYVNKAEGDSALTDEQVEEDGNACTMYGHYNGISAVSFMDELTSCVEAYDLTLTFNKSYGYKSLYTYHTGNEEYTCYELCDVFATSGLGKDGIATYYDYNTGEIHGIFAWAKVNEYADGSAILALFNGMLDALDDSNLSGAERDNVIQYLEEYITKSDLTPESDDTVQISVGDWDIYVERRTTDISVYLSAKY